MQSFAINKHGINLMQDCESCHGPMSKHMEAPRRKPALVVALSEKGKLSPEQKSSVCLQCHQGGKRMNWPVSVHSSVGNDCTTCHNIEAPTDPVLVKTSQTDVCFTCHQDKRAQILRRSRHPVREGKVVCSDCHNPHGSPVPTNLTKNTVNEVCYQCHQDKRGPFLWEHQPVREDCTICHDPHGSTHYRMLKVAPPYLCEECHNPGPGGHPSALRSGAEVVPPGPTTQSRYTLIKGCANCHSQIHGSNHPSGVRFNR
jgi:DmsE family decaheme c-type cytochrome